MPDTPAVTCAPELAVPELVAPVELVVEEFL